jgi:mono/diheme cytochrome c family protein
MRTVVPRPIGAVSLLAPAILGLAIGAVLRLDAQEAAARPDASAAAVGADLFRNYCASCHGTEGRGDGPLAEHLRTQPTDLTGISTRHDGEFPFDDVVESIDGGRAIGSHGSADMPAWGDALSKSRNQPDQAEVQRRIDALAHFVWSIQKREG